MNCPACANLIDPLHARQIPYPQKRGGKRALFERIFSCSVCGLGVAWPLSTEKELAEFYGAGEYWGQTLVRGISPREYPGAYASARTRWGFIRESLGDLSLRGLTVLDVGAGQGMMGWVIAQDPAVRLKAYHVIEQDRYSLESLRRTWKKRFSHVAFDGRENADNTGQKYDLIVLSHVLEHMPDPIMVLKRMKEMLVPDGRVMVDVPFQDHLYKADVFPHVLFFNEKALKEAIERSGLRMVRMLGFGISKGQAGILSERPGLLERMVFRFRVLLPLFVSVGLYDRKWRPGCVNADGIWLRGVLTHQS